LAGSDDSVVLAQLAQFYDAQGKGEEAAELYRRVLRLDPQHPTAAANLGIYLTQSGQSQRAMELWKDVFARYPALVGPGMNLAVAQYEAGDLKASETTLLRILRFHPDFTAARQLLTRLRR
jgi:Tfp pilus assembly protein PilF